MSKCRNCATPLSVLVATNDEGTFAGTFFTGKKGDFTPPFCPECGAFQPTLATPELDLPEGALEFRNPMHFKADLPAQGTPASIGAKLTTRAKFEAATKGSPFTAPALRQYAEELEPLIAEGRADGLFADLVAQYWARAGALVGHFKSLRKQASDSETQYPDQAALFQKLVLWGSEAAKPAMQAVVTEGSTYQLHLRALEFEFALGECQQAAYKWSSFLRVKRAKKLGQPFLSHLAAHFESSSNPRAFVDKVTNLARTRMEAKFWDPEESYAAAVLKRYQKLSSELAEVLVPQTPLVVLDWKHWFLAKGTVLMGKGWISAFPISHMKSSVEEIEQEVAEGEEALSSVVHEMLTLLKDNEAAQKAERDGKRAARERSEAISQLVLEQQLARQLSEGKYGSALVTSFAGTTAGASFEGSSR